MKLKKADEIELDEINLLIVESEIVITNGAVNLDAFIEKYTIDKSCLLTNLSYVLYENDRMIGFFMLIGKGYEYELEYFYIEHSRLGKGLGKILWNYLNDICIENNIPNVSIVCGKYVTGFYLKMGAEKIGEIDSKINHEEKIELLQ